MRGLNALAATAALVAAVLAQYVVPAWQGFHTWQYAGVLSVLMAIPFTFIVSAFRRKGASEEDRRLAVAFIGAVVVGFTGLASGLLGTDPVHVVRSPGTVTPLPDIRAAAFFPSVDAETIARGDAPIILRRRGEPGITVQRGGAYFVGSYIIKQEPRIAAYIEARDMHGKHLTITQPSGSAFLSPVLLFPSTVRIEARELPSDSFATPALHRYVEAMYFSPETIRTTRAYQSVGNHAALLFAVNTEAGHVLPGGIGLAPEGRMTEVGGLSLKPTLGSYPALLMCAIPAPPALGLGGAWLVLGLFRVFGRHFRRKADKGEE